MSNGEDRKGQLGLGVARVVSMVIVALLKEGVVGGLMAQTGFPQAEAAAPPAWTVLPSPLPHSMALNLRGALLLFPKLLPQTGRVTPYLSPYKGRALSFLVTT